MTKPSKKGCRFSIVLAVVLLLGGGILFQYTDAGTLFFYGLGLNDRVYLHLSPIFQWKEQPNDCEDAALSLVLNYLGVPCDKQTLSGQSPAKPANAQPVNNPSMPNCGKSGCDCLAQPVLDAANHLLGNVDSNQKAKDLSGQSFENLLDYVAQGLPVILWTTPEFAQPTKNAQSPANGKSSHCVVLCGFDGNDIAYVADPLGAVSQRGVSMDALQNAFESLGSPALVIL